MKKIFLSLCIFQSLLFAQPPLYSFFNANINYFDWDKKTQDQVNEHDYWYVGIEGGFGYESLNYYGFLNTYNPLDAYNSKDDATPFAISAFNDLDLEVSNNFKMHIQNYTYNSNTYYVNDLVLGAGYKLVTNVGLWFRPFLGLHHTYSTYYKGLNGYMTGWLLSYDFTLFDHQCNIFQWNEIEFQRDKNFYLDDTNQPIGDGANWGLNGAISGWFYINKSFVTGVQYRYAKNKLGHHTYQSALIYTLKYNFF